MNKRLLFIFGIAIIFLLAGGTWLFFWILKPAQEASGPIQATPISLSDEITAAPTVIEVTTTPKDAPEATSTEDISNPGGDSSGSTNIETDALVIYSIKSEESQALFNIFEELAGQPKDVIGTTNQVAGEVAFNPNDLSQIKFGPIQVNARTFVTDSNQRNSAIRNRILNTDQYEFITFMPNEINSISGIGMVGQEYNFQLTGDLTIRNITQPVTFDLTVIAESETKITGVAKAVISRADYNLIIPSVPNVANVADEFTIELSFVLVPRE